MNTDTQNPLNWWQGAVIYQIYPRSFCDSNGDGIGDLNGITNKLDYVADLGVDGIWISPFFMSPMHDFGYDISDFRAVDPIFGTLVDFDTLLTKAHSLGLKVIIDQVYSHASTECAWFKESKKDKTNDKADWFVWADACADGGPPNNWQAVFAGPAWTWDASRKQYYMHNFLSEQPDLNLHNPDVQKEILSVAEFWLGRGVDGFRLDATNHYMHNPALIDNPAIENPNGVRPFDFQDQINNQSHPDIVSFLKRLRILLDSYGDKFTVAEVGGRRSLEEMAQYTAGDNLLNTAYSFIFLEEDTLSPNVIKKALSDWSEQTSSWPSWTFSNHDRQRVVSRWGNGANEKQFAKLMNTLLCSLRGTLFMYQGEELGLPHADIPFDRIVDPEALKNWPETLNRDGARSPIPWCEAGQDACWQENSWLPIDPRHFELNVADQEQDQNSSLNFTKDLLAFRKEHPSLIKGSIEFLDASQHLLSFKRTFGKDTVVCTFNLNDKEQAYSINPDAETCFRVGEYNNTQEILAAYSGVITKI